MNKDSKKRAGPTPYGYFQRKYIKGVGLSLVWVKCNPFQPLWSPLLTPDHASDRGTCFDYRTSSFEDRIYYYLYNKCAQNDPVSGRTTLHYYVVLTSAESAMVGLIVVKLVVFIWFSYGFVPAIGAMLIASALRDDLMRVKSQAVSMKRTVAVLLVTGWIIRLMVAIRCLHKVWRV